MQEMTEEDLMQAYVAGDRRAFEHLFARLAPRLFAFFLRSFRNAPVAEDLLQKTFLKLHQARDRYKAHLPLRPWVFTIAARVCSDERRRLVRSPEQSGEQSRDEEVGAAHDRPEADLIEEVRAAIEELPESLRIVVQLHRYEGLTFSEIAEVLGTSAGAVRVRAFRAYERLRGLLGGRPEARKDT